jgi:hypothetical protein
MSDKTEKPTGLALLRVPFEPHQISKLPKQAGWMAEKKNEYKSCGECGGWHHPKAVHLDYVGHAALTDRLLDCDPEWNWEPLAVSEDGSPKLDANGGMWIKLTVCNVSRLGYGHPDGKKGGDAIKEVIGDALRNAAMRFGAALDLWHKGQLRAEPENDDAPAKKRVGDVHDNTLDWDDLLPAVEGVEQLNSAQSRPLYKALEGSLKMAQTACEAAHWAHENAGEIWKLHPTARHYLREAYDKLTEQLMEAA